MAIGLWSVLFECRIETQNVFLFDIWMSYECTVLMISLSHYPGDGATASRSGYCEVIEAE